MAGFKVASPDTISRDEFGEILGRYAALIQEVSATKGGKSALHPRDLQFYGPPKVGINHFRITAKAGQQTLEQLDQYRYGEALDTFGSKKNPQSMELDHVKILVSWKL